MVADVKVVSDDLLKLSKALKGWDSEFRKQLHRDIREVGKPMVPVIREALQEDYPKRGGLAERMSKARITPKFRTGREPGVAWQVRGLQIKLGELYGKLRHPVFADQDKTRKQWRWAEQSVHLGAMQKRVTEKASTMVPALESVLSKTADAVLKKVSG